MTTPAVTITPGTDGSIAVAYYPWRVFRFLLSGGTVFDVLAIRDDSDLRSAVLQHTGAARIDGATEVPQ